MTEQLSKDETLNELFEENPDELKEKKIWQRDKMEKIDHLHNKIMLNFEIELQEIAKGVVNWNLYKANFSVALMKVLDEEIDH